MRKTKNLALLLALALFMTLALTACGGGLSGSFKSEDGTILTFSGSSVQMKLPPAATQQYGQEMIIKGSYTLKGTTLTITANKNDNIDVLKTMILKEMEGSGQTLSDQELNAAIDSAWTSGGMGAAQTGVYDSAKGTITINDNVYTKQ